MADRGQAIASVEEISPTGGHANVAAPIADSVTQSLRLQPARFINRELSWLHFNRRGLREAAKPHHPPLEKPRLLPIPAAHLDEFFLVRGGAPTGAGRGGGAAVSPEGLTPADQRARRVKDFVRQLRCKGPVFEISALTREGCEALVRAVYEEVAKSRSPVVALPDARFDERVHGGAAAVAAGHD